jgi:hypothetical protein
MTSAASSGATSFSLGGLQASATVLKVGDYIQIENRLYKIDADLVTNSSGIGTVYLTSPLIGDAPLGSPVYITNASCEMRLLKSQWSGSRDGNTAFVSLSLEFLETVNDNPYVSFVGAPPR